MKSNNKSIMAVSGSLFLALLPVFVLAAPTPQVCASKLCQLVSEFGNIINVGIGVVASLALLVFFWGLVKYILASGDEKAKEQGKNVMIGGVIALFVLFSTFGIIRFLRDAFLVGGDTSLPPPTVGFPKINQ